jgi:Flp pilus assembly protein TadD
MPNVYLAAGFRAAALMSFSLIANAIAIVPARGQALSNNSFGQNRIFGYSSRGLIALEESMSSSPDAPKQAYAGPATVSSDVLRHPLTSKARRRLQKALHLAELGEHPAAIQELRETLLKEPSSAPYAQNILGVEYVANEQFAEARSSFEEAVRLMPHESANHSNLGYTLAVAGDFNAAEQEERTAIQLDPANDRAKTLLAMLHSRKAKKH